MKLSQYLSAFLFVAFMAASPVAHAQQEGGTKAEAQDMTTKAVFLINTQGRGAAFDAFDKADGGFKKKDLYVFVYDLEGVNVFHAANKALQGKNLITLKDPNGKLLIADIVSTCKDKGEGWVDYMWFDKDIGKVLAKSSFVKKTNDDLCVGVGVYTH